ncbi:hypothetical protein Xcel_1444 [Xylanimonas cellulosilytica DSM 15894]|uniref:Uncharacterized protein n=1 Tax=Xylanimonas cellulosilytica (strain DSM 15894 / JCM 12276 / CECT 5975 / KCTC 9989 / LMG 20990 / NBRC 107835 / XIL07) TaxID=446471 RepID=D1BRY3_XYLCX|nr:hypothetical protein [Xylanimonas cellulosilytica]ACZ30475.1 hypothetical protein Xcel_1444 [Xylanimonas cellulosilytica DSM 15894]
MTRPEPQQPALRPLHQSTGARPVVWAATVIAPLASLAGLLLLQSHTDTTWVRALLLVACGVLLVIAGAMIRFAVRAARSAQQHAATRQHPHHDDADER